MADLSKWGRISPEIHFWPQNLENQNFLLMNFLNSRIPAFLSVFKPYLPYTAKLKLGQG